MLTVHQILAAYRTGSSTHRADLRQRYLRLHLEFDAIDRAEERNARIAAHANHRALERGSTT